MLKNAIYRVFFPVICSHPIQLLDFTSCFLKKKRRECLFFVHLWLYTAMESTHNSFIMRQYKIFPHNKKTFVLKETCFMLERNL